MAWKGRERLLFFCVCFCVVLKSRSFFLKRLQLMNILLQLYNYELLAISMDVSSFRLTNMLPWNILIFPDQIPCAKLIDELQKTNLGKRAGLFLWGVIERKRPSAVSTCFCINFQPWKKMHSFVKCQANKGGIIQKLLALQMFLVSPWKLPKIARLTNRWVVVETTTWFCVFFSWWQPFSVY